MSDSYKIMLEDAIRSLAAIDEALGIGEDGRSYLEQTLYAIAELKAAAAQGEALALVNQTISGTCIT